MARIVLCRILKSSLDREGIDYVEIDIEETPGATEQLACGHADSLIGIHLTDVPFFHAFQRPDELSRAEQKYFEALDKFYNGQGVPEKTIISDKEYTKENAQAELANAY